MLGSRSKELGECWAIGVGCTREENKLGAVGNLSAARVLTNTAEPHMAGTRHEELGADNRIHLLITGSLRKYEL